MRLLFEGGYYSMCGYYSKKNKSRPRIVVVVNYIHALRHRVGIAQPTYIRT